MSRQKLCIVGAVILMLFITSCSKPEEEAGAVVHNLNNASRTLDYLAYDMRKVNNICKDYGFNNYILLSVFDGKTEYTYDELCKAAGNSLVQNQFGQRAVLGIYMFGTIKHAFMTKHEHEYNVYMGDAEESMKILLENHPKYKYNDLIQTYYKAIKEYWNTMTGIIYIPDVTRDIDKQGAVIKMYRDQLMMLDNYEVEEESE